MTIETFPWDIQEHLQTPTDCAALLEVLFLDEDTTAADVARVLGQIGRSRGMTELARQTGVSREALYKGLSDSGNPTLSTLMAVVKAFGLRLAVVPIDAAEPASSARHAA